MGRPPCCDKVGIKKGPWTPEEDIILVSYIQEHGPGNWRSVPTNTGLLRCSKSCRLRWTNYLRPGIKRGNFTPHEEGMIVHLQALLGNKWAAIASYLPQRTDNDIKNYWNTHLKKKLKKFQSSLEPQSSSTSKVLNIERNNNDNNSNNNSNNNNIEFASSTSSTYASSTENISRLLQGWMRSSPKTTNNDDDDGHGDAAGSYRPKAEKEGGDLIYHEEFESILSFGDMNNVAACEFASKGSCRDDDDDDDDEHVNVTNKKQKDDMNNNKNDNPPLSFIEKWLLDESCAGQVEEMNQMMEISSIF